jgi:lipooligosaccharide transport system permease protein
VTTQTLPLAVPSSTFAGARLLVLRHLWVLRHNRPWTLIVNGVFEPFLYLMSIGFGIGGLITSGPQGGAYAAFVAPALLATSAMNAAVNETTGTFWFRLRFSKVYQSMLTTPMRVNDIAVGEVISSMLRGAVASSCFLVVIAALGLIHSWWALLAVPGTLLIAFGFSGAGVGVSTYLKAFHHHQYVQLFMLPMFLFATTFYPLSVYPVPLQWVVACLPLYQSTELLRGVILGDLGPSVVGAAVYLVALGLIGLWIAERRLGRLLLS